MRSLEEEDAHTKSVQSTELPKEHGSKAETESHGKTKDSVSFPVKRSGLAARRIDAPAAFHSLESTNDHTFTGGRHSETGVESPSSDHTSSSRLSSASPPRKKVRRKTKSEDVDNAHHLSLSVEKDSEGNASEHRSTKLVYDEDAEVNNAEGLGKETSSEKTTRGGRAHKHRRNKSYSENDSLVPTVKTRSVLESASCGHPAVFAQSPIAHHSYPSGSLVAYNSSDEDNARPSNRHGDTNDKGKKRQQAEPQHKHKKRNGSHAKTEEAKHHSAHHHHSTNDFRHSPSDRQASLRVVKSTAKSSWDSSDSEFEATTSESKKAPVTLPTSSPLAIPPDHTGGSSPERPSVQRKCKLSKRRISQESHVSLEKSASVASVDRHGPDNLTDDSFEAERAEAQQSPLKREKRKHRNHKRSERKRRKSDSSYSSVASVNEVLPASRSNRSGGSGRDRGHSRSRHSVSSRSSGSVSKYSSGSSRSSGWRRHRGRHRRRSKSYTSNSSSRDSSHFSHSDYRNRSKSSSRSDRRHRHHNRSYRRHYRRRSYSSRSPTRSHSYGSSDTSTRSSYHSSRSSSTRRSTPASHRRSTTHRSSSHQSLGNRKHSSTPLPPHATDIMRSPTECRSRLGTGSVRRGSVSVSAAGDSLPTSTYSFASATDVAETVSAAVKRVTGGNLSSARNNNSMDLPTMNTAKSTKTSEEKSEREKSASGLVDIPLPTDPKRSSKNFGRQTKSMAPYIGPQLPPELAERFGLSVGAQDSSVTDSSKSDIVNPSMDEEKQTSESTQGPITNTVQEPQSHSLEFLIPPDKVEQYKALQEQAKQHAMRRTNILVSGSGDANTGATPELDAQAQQLALLQSLSRSQALVSSNGVVLPAYSTNACLLTNLSTPVASLSTVTPSTVENWNNQLPQLSNDMRARQLVAVMAAQQQAGAITNQMQQQVLAQLAIPGMAAFRADQLAVSPTIARPPNAYEMAGLPYVTPASLPYQQLQQAQLQQLLNAAAAIQAAQTGAGAVTVQAQHPSQVAVTAQLLQQLATQQTQQKVSASSLSSNAVTASILAAHQQQQRLFAQFQKQTIPNSSLQEENITSFATCPTIITDANQSAANENLSAASLAWPTALVRGRTAGCATTAPATSTSVTTPQTQAAAVAALLAAAQQQQQQQIAAGIARQSTAAVVPQPFAVSSTTPHDTATHQAFYSFQLPTAINRLIAAQQLQQHQQLLALHALSAQQKQLQFQQQQQQQQQQQRLLASVATSAADPQAVLQAHLAVAAAVQQQQQRQQQQMVVQAQLQQQQQQAIAASALLAAQRQQQAAQDHASSGKTV
ncbi:unnamed protein product [Calicophoron daubneyi]